MTKKAKTLFHKVYKDQDLYHTMSQILKHKCPTCGTNAKGKKEIREIFGFRLSNGKETSQSYCISCRGSHAKKMQRRADKNPLIAKLDMRKTKSKEKIKVGN